MNKLIKRRILAFLVDYVVIVLYASILYAITMTIDPPKMSPYLGAIIGFLSLTLPVFLYFYLSEKSNSKGTLGKRFMRIAVNSYSQNQNKSILIRNLFKFLPWEMAHYGVHWLVYLSSSVVAIPNWVWVTLVLPQLTVLAYLISIIISQGRRSLYDQLAGTQIDPIIN